MERKEFLKTCGFTCIGMACFASVLQSCSSVKLIQIISIDNILTIPRTDFSHVGKNNSQMRRYIIIKTSVLDFPIVVYRFSDKAYSALLLKCSHQGNELNVYGDILSCPAHGSEYNNKGEIIQGPADALLTSYKISSDTNCIYIHLA